MDYRYRMLLIGVFLMGLLGACFGIDLRELRSARQEMADARECVHAILQCTSAYAPVTNDRFEGGGLFESTHQLEGACRQNGGFFDCLEDAKKFCVERNIERVEVEMIKNRLWARDLCSKNSKWKKWYVKWAPCVNREFPRATDHCKSNFPDPPANAGIKEICRFLDDLVDCRSKIFKQTCSDTAADLYRRIARLNGGREYLCREPQTILDHDSPHQTIIDQDSPQLIAAQLLNNVRTLMKNFSKIVRDTMGPEVAADVLQDINPRNLNFDNPFDMDTNEFVEMLKGAMPNGIFDLLKSERGHFGKSVFDTEDLLAEYDLEEFSDRPESTKEDWVEMPTGFKSFSVDPTKSVEHTKTEPEHDIEIQEDQMDSSIETLTEQDDPISNEMDGSTEDQLSCRKFDEFEVPSFKSNASFHVYVYNGGQKSHLGSGQTMVQWKAFQQISLDDLFCSWMDRENSNRLFRCAIKLTDLKYLKPEKKSWSHPVLLSLYSTPEAVDHSQETSLSEIATICVENYKPSADISIETEESAYPPKSTLKEYMHERDIHRSGDSWDEADSNKATEEESSESTDSVLERTYSLGDNPESFYEGSIELCAKEIPQDKPENELDVPFDANVSYLSPDEYEIPEKRNFVDEKLNSFYDVNYLKSPHPTDKQHLTYYSILDEVSKEDSSEFTTKAPQTCESDTHSLDCPKSDRSVDVNPVQIDPTNQWSHKTSQDCYPNIQRNQGASIRPGVYIDARNIETIDPFKGLDMRQFEESPFVENVNYIVVGDPYFPSSDTEDSTYFVTPSAKTLPSEMTQSDLEKFIEDEFENIYAEEMATHI